MRSTKSRPYTMRRRAELVDQTRLRITEAAIRLHTTVGPANTSIAAVAEEAGVTRLTVYRHFADADALFEACRGHWLSQHPPPDPGAWSSVTDLESRARVAFGELYAWFRDHADELYPIARDGASLPVSARQARAAENRALAGALVAGFVMEDADGRALLAVAGHLTDFLTWRSLAIQRGLGDREVIDVAVRLLVSLVGPVAGQQDARPEDPAGR